MSVILRERDCADGRISLYLDIYHKGKRRTETLHIYLDGQKDFDREKRQRANAIRAKRESDLLNSLHGVFGPSQANENFLDFFKKVQAMKSDASQRNWDAVYKRLKDYDGEVIPFSSLNVEWLKGLKAYLQKELGQNTAAVYFAAVKTVLYEAALANKIQDNPAEKVSGVPIVESERVYLEFEEVQRLARTPVKNNELRRAFLFACYTGLRKSDIRALTWREVRGGRVEFSQEKTDRRVYIELGPPALELLGEPGELDEPVFRLPSNSHISLVLARWCRDAGITKNVTFHSSRHTFATLLLTYDADLYTVSKLLGHKNIQTTQVYARVIDRKRSEAIHRLPSFSEDPGTSQR